MVYPKTKHGGVACVTIDLLSDCCSNALADQTPRLTELAMRLCRTMHSEMVQLADRPID